MGKVRAASGVVFLGWAAAFGLLAGESARAEAHGSCEAWPGEPSPLPALQDPDPVRARWAELRAAELAEHARVLEAHDRIEAHRLWQRLRCFDPASPELRRALHRTRPIRLHRPEVEVAQAPEAEAPDRGWDVLGEPLAIHDSARQAQERARYLANIDRWIGRVEEGVRQARFDDALAAAVRTRSLLDRMRWADDLLPRWVRLEVAEATVQIALGRDAEASACAARALEREPDLVLDEQRHPPKLVRVFESARLELEAQL